MVHIDKQGKVSDARILEEEDAPKLVIPYVLQAARVWQFEPARRDGTPVESDTVILFRFGAQ
jgi:outer membrane biosynthesis protein TonB